MKDKNNDSITLDPEFGLAPLLGVCPCCHKDNDEIVFAGAAIRRMKTVDGKPVHPNDTTKIISSLCDSCVQELQNGGIWVREGRLNSDGSTTFTYNGILLKEPAASVFFTNGFYEEMKGRAIAATPEDFKAMSEALKRATRPPEQIEEGTTDDNAKETL
jgi:hypothetical protein